MFVRAQRRSVGYEYLYLVENAREGGRHVQRVVKALGRRDQMENSDLLDGKVEADAQFDGIFVLRTNMKLSALAVVLRYRNLLAVERSFLTSKALFATRPVFHRTDAAIRGHIFCTFLALVLRKELLIDWLRAAPFCRNGSTLSTI